MIIKLAYLLALLFWQPSMGGNGLDDRSPKRRQGYERRKREENRRLDELREKYESYQESKEQYSKDSTEENQKKCNATLGELEETIKTILK